MEQMKVIMDPVNIFFGFILAIFTVTILKKIYIENENIAEEAGFNLKFLNDFMELAYESCEFEGTAGGKKKNYVDTDKLLACPKLLHDSISNVVEKLKDYPKAKICFVEKDSGPIGMILYAGLIAKMLDRPVSIIRVRREVWKMSIKGEPIQESDQVILIQDVVSTNLQSSWANRKLMKLGAEVIAVVTLVDREERRSESSLKNDDINTISILKLKDIEENYKNRHKPVFC